MKILKKLLPYIIIVVVVVLIRTFLVTPAIVNGESMESTLKDGEVVVVNKIFVRSAEPNRYDIFVIKVDGEHIIKRIVGLPGESVEYKNNKLYINGKEITSELSFEATEDFKYPRVEDGKYFVLGDNRDVSKDSRMIGTVSKDDLIGKVNIVLFPFKKAGMVK